MTNRADGETGDNGSVNENTGDQAATPAPGAEATPSSAAKGDAFTRAYAAAQKATGDPDAPKDDKPAAKPAKKAEDKAEKPKAEDKPKDKAEDKPAPKTDEKAAKATKGDGEADAEDEDGEKKPAEPLKPRRGWSRRRQEDFGYLDPETQAAWLAEDMTPPPHWDDESKAAFGKLPVEAKDELLYRSTQIEKGYQAKFTALADERKQIEDIKAAVPPRVRALMTGRNINEATAFKALVGLQEHALADPVGYLADFIKRGNVDVNELADRIMGDAASQGRTTQRQAQPPIELHPAFQELKAGYDQLKAHIQGQAQTAKAEADKEAEFEIKTAFAERDEGGELRYPFARVLSNYMADLMEDDPESFKELPPRKRFDLAYRTALAAHPELKRSPKTAPPAPKSGDHDGDDTGGDKRAERAKAAQTVKSKSPASAAAKSSGGDAFSAAYDKAQRQMGLA